MNMYSYEYNKTIFYICQAQNIIYDLFQVYGVAVR